MRSIAYSKDALRTLARIPANTAMQIRRKIESYAADPASQANNVRALTGRPGFLRLRVGDWRVIFSDDGRVVAVIKVGPRGDVYD